MHTGCPVQGNARGRDSAERRRASPRLNRSVAMAENRTVPKAAFAIAGIGVAGCVLLASMMKQLVQHRRTQQDAPTVAAVAQQFAPRLASPLALREEHDGDRVRLVAHARAAAGEDRARLAGAIAAALSRRAHDDERVGEIEVTLRDANGDAPVSALVRRPAPAR